MKKFVLGPGKYAGFMPGIAARKPAKKDANMSSIEDVLITEIHIRIEEGQSINSMDGGVGKVRSS